MTCSLRITLLLSLHGQTMSATPLTTAGTTPLSDRELRAWRGMLRVHASLWKTLEADLEAAHGLPLSSFEVLMFLADAEDERMRMCDLATSVVLSRSGLTRLVDRLERDGLLTREACKADARGAYAKLTPAGRRKLDIAREVYLDGVRERFLGRLSGDEQELLGDLWERVLPDAHAPGPACGADGAR